MRWIREQRALPSNTTGARAARRRRITTSWTESFDIGEEALDRLYALVTERVLGKQWMEIEVGMIEKQGTTTTPRRSSWKRPTSPR